MSFIHHKSDVQYIFLGLFNIKKVFSILVLNLGENKGSHLILPRIVLI